MIWTQTRSVSGVRSWLLVWVRDPGGTRSGTRPVFASMTQVSFVFVNQNRGIIDIDWVGRVPQNNYLDEDMSFLLHSAVFTDHTEEPVTSKKNPVV